MKIESAENIVAIVNFLAKCASFQNPYAHQLADKIRALMQDDADPFVREVLVALKEGGHVLAQDADVLQALRKY